MNQISGLSNQQIEKDKKILPLKKPVQTCTIPYNTQNKPVQTQNKPNTNSLQPKQGAKRTITLIHQPNSPQKSTTRGYFRSYP